MFAELISVVETIVPALMVVPTMFVAVIFVANKVSVTFKAPVVIFVSYKLVVVILTVVIVPATYKSLDTYKLLPVIVVPAIKLDATVLAFNVPVESAV